MQAETVQDLTFTGLTTEAVVVADELLEQPLPVDTRTWAEVLRAEALSHLGRFTEASASLAGIEHLLADDWGSRGEALTTRAGIAYWSGDLREAIARADKALAIPTFYAANHMLTALTRSWASFELGQSPAPLPAALRGWLADAANAEWAALHARSLGMPSHDLFLLAAARWEGHMALREILCRWAAADAARLAGAPDAGARLRDVLTDAERLGYEPIARRVRRSLRLAGVRVPRAQPPVPGTALLTPREHEILGLVGDGLANIEIARRMGLGRPTVARIVSNAMAKLGAETRAQAVALVQAIAG
jgi:DNA-binding CsgD family transcriptional regulator